MIRKLKWTCDIFFIILLFSFSFVGRVSYSEELSDKEIQAEREKIRQEALKIPYPEDFGKEFITDAELSEYTSEQQEGYKIVINENKCSACHSSARVLNTPLVELSDGKSKKNGYNESKDEMKKFQVSHPGIFIDATIWEIDSSTWKRHIKRMIAKPGATISKQEAKIVYRFLKEYSIREKVIKHQEWKDYRSILVKDFKEKYSERYDELFDEGSEDEGH